MNPTEFTILLKTVRDNNNVTLRALGDAIGLSSPYLHDLENGNRTPNEKLVESLISFYNLDENGKRMMYDAVAKSTGNLPFDVIRFLKNNPECLSHVIEIMNESNSRKEGR